MVLRELVIIDSLQSCNPLVQAGFKVFQPGLVKFNCAQNLFFLINEGKERFELLLKIVKTVLG